MLSTPAGTRRQNDVFITTSFQRHDVAPTSIQSCSNVVCRLVLYEGNSLSTIYNVQEYFNMEIQNNNKMESLSKAETQLVKKTELHFISEKHSLALVQK